MSKEICTRFGPGGAKVLLTQLARIASSHSKGRVWLEQSISGRLERLAETTLDVVVETGGPIGQVLAEQIMESASVELASDLKIEFSWIVGHLSEELERLRVSAAIRCARVRRRLLFRRFAFCMIAMVFVLIVVYIVIVSKNRMLDINLGKLDTGLPKNMDIPRPVEPKPNQRVLDQVTQEGIENHENGLSSSIPERMPTIVDDHGVLSPDSVVSKEAAEEDPRDQ